MTVASKVCEISRSSATRAAFNTRGQPLCKSHAEINKRLAQDLAQDPEFKPAQPTIHAGRPIKEDNVDQIYISKGDSNTSAARIVARLKRDRPDIAERLAAG